MYGKGAERREQEVVFELKEEVGELEEDLKRQTQMNGISLNSCTRKNIRNSKMTENFP